LLLFFADHGDDGEAARRGDFDGEPADAADGAGDDEGLTGGQLEVGQAAPGGKPVQPDGGELGGRQVPGDRHYVADRQRDQGGLGAAQALEPQAESQDSRPDDRRVDALAGRHDAPGDIPAGGVGRGGPPRQARGDGAGDHGEVRRVDGGGFAADQDFPLTRTGLRHLGDRHVLDPELPYPHRFHDCHSSGSRQGLTPDMLT